METVHLLIAFAVVYTPNLLFLCNTEIIYYVKPTDPLDIHDRSFDPDALCPGNPCYSFEYYLQNYSLFLISNTRIQFLPGAHLLDMGPEESLIDFSGITNLTLMGSKTSGQTEPGEIMPESIFICLSKIGFVFSKNEGLLIQGLVLDNCGSQPHPEFNIAFALGLFNVTNACLSHVLIINSGGYGIMGLNVLGISSITDSAVLASQDSEKYSGGNVFLQFYPSEFDCIRLGNDTIRFSIKSSTFAYGNTIHNGSTAAGLRMFIQSSCSNSYIHVFNSSFY